MPKADYTKDEKILLSMIQKYRIEIIDIVKDLLKASDKYQSNVYELESRGDSLKNINSFNVAQF